MQPSKANTIKRYFKEGEPFVWITASALSLILLMALIMLLVILKNGMGAFWPTELSLFELKDGSRFLGEVVQVQEDKNTKKHSYQLKIGNRDLYGLDFKWIKEEELQSQRQPAEAYRLERTEYGNFYGFLKSVESPDLATGLLPDQALALGLAAAHRDRLIMQRLEDQIKTNAQESESLRLKILAMEYKHQTGPKLKLLKAELEAQKKAFQQLVDEQQKAQALINRHQAVFVEAGGQEKAIFLGQVERLIQPNQAKLSAKLAYYLARLWELFSAEPRESNTEGGLFPAMVGTVVLVFLMSFLSFPLGVVAALYMKEYAKDGWLLRLIRVAVNNLAGIPSIVWGIFGLVFFVYTLGGAIDGLFFPERLPTPTFGTGSLIWAALTLGLLTVPVVIVATEEALGSVPAEIRHGSLALGATKIQTLVRVILPMASPRIMTGFILAMSRAAGEVAPLMITGVVKLAPSLPVDGSFPFFHLERKFMHLGFHIYDIGFQSPNAEAAKPMVFVTTLILLAVVMFMNSLAIALRNKMKNRVETKAF